MSNAETQKELITVIETIADNKYIIGDRLVEVGVGGPDLEASLSAIAMAQAELGHARLLYNWTFDMKGHKGKKPEVSEQTGKAFSSVVGINNWISLIAGLYTVNVSFDILMKAIVRTEHPEVVSHFTKLLKEQNEHIVYSKSWASKLLNESGSIPKRFQKALNESYVEAEKWLDSIEQNAALTAAGYLLKDENLTEIFKKEMARMRSHEAVVNAG
jgi:ring-1,2-phenylacetyl-CoA epoxidase subunit PaaC